MTTLTTKIERSGPVVRAVLAEFAPQECAVFEEQFRQALRSAEQHLDLGPARAVLDRWWGIAAIGANPLSSAERDLVSRPAPGTTPAGPTGRPPATRTGRCPVHRPVVPDPLEQYEALSEAAQQQIDLRVAELLEQPEGPVQPYDPPNDQWTTTYGAGAGLIVYAVVHPYRLVLILRLI